MGIANDLSSFTATVIRLGRGLYPRITAADRQGPAEPLDLYDFEGCPYCRKVREVLSELDLDYISYPVARGSARRVELRKRGGKVQVPYLVDPNTGEAMYESEDIVVYLNRTYGGSRPAGWSVPIPGLVDDLVSAAASAARLGAGTRCRTSQRHDLRPLELYNMEGSPYCRKVRETLTELDLVHLVHNVPKGSPKRRELERRGGKVMVPYLIDPNRGEEMYESDDIVSYLRKHYGTPTHEDSPTRRAATRKGKVSGTKGRAGLR
ncbi:glutathione S-transferase N-terminal domain-containing protein [Candidatus Binatia bacterium]|nr:glutathione S-transferase N-terminal domain-containing protein [Candidatus Binatia bacterium]